MMRFKKFPILLPLIFAFFSAFSSPSLAVNPDEILADPVLETRARAISAELRCLVCQNQSIDDSDAGLAKDLRLLVRERLVAGDSDSEVVTYLVDRYGEFVLLKPYFGWHTLALWSSAPLVMLASVFALMVHLRNKKTSQKPVPASSAKLSKEEQEALDSLLDKE